MGRLRGETVILYEKTAIGKDPAGVMQYRETPVAVNNVLIGEPSTDDIVTSTDLYGKKIVYMLGIPKGDTHDWEDKTVEFWGCRYRTFGFPIQGIEVNLPQKMPWHMKVRVEAYE